MESSQGQTQDYQAQFTLNSQRIHKSHSIPKTATINENQNDAWYLQLFHCTLH